MNKIITTGNPREVENNLYTRDTRGNLKIPVENSIHSRIARAPSRNFRWKLFCGDARGHHHHRRL